MKKLLLYAMLIITAQSQSQTITDLLNNSEFTYIHSTGIKGDELVFTTGTKFVFNYDLSGANGALNATDIGLDETEVLYDIAFTDEHVYMLVSEDNFENGKIIRRDAVDLKSNEVLIYDASDTFFGASFQLLIRDNFLYFHSEGVIRRINLNNNNQVEDYFTIPTLDEDDFIAGYTFSGDKFYYGPLLYDETKDLEVYELDANDPMGSVEKMVFLAPNPNASISLEQLTIIDDVLYMAITDSETFNSPEFYSIQQVDVSNPNATPVEIVGGEGGITSFSVYNNLLHFTLVSNTVSKLARVENSLSTPNVDNTLDFKITPNPNNGSFSLKGLKNKEIKQVTLFDLAGREVYKSQENLVLNSEIDLVLNLSSGAYVLALETANGVSRQKMVIK